MNITKESVVWLIVVACFVSFWILSAWLQDRKRDRTPIYEVRAVIVSKRVVGEAVRGVYGHRNAFSYYIIFKLEDGTQVELSASEDGGRFLLGTAGTLVYQGTKCEKFTPDE